MKSFFRTMAANLGVVGEVLFFLWQQKMWWMIPMVAVLMVFGLLLIFASASGVGPFIYTLFYMLSRPVVRVFLIAWMIAAVSFRLRVNLYAPFTNALTDWGFWPPTELMQLLQ